MPTPRKRKPAQSRKIGKFVPLSFSDSEKAFINGQPDFKTAGIAAFMQNVSDADWKFSFSAATGDRGYQVYLTCKKKGSSMYDDCFAIQHPDPEKLLKIAAVVWQETLGADIYPARFDAQAEDW